MATSSGAAGASGMDERREDQRVSILGELHGEVMVFQPMAITEIGPGGAVVETAFPLHLDSLHDLRLELTDRSIVVKGRVTHCTIIDVDQELVRYRSGVQFVEPSDHVAGAIAAFVQTIRDERRGIQQEE
jgi:hypothetical protein